MALLAPVVAMTFLVSGCLDQAVKPQSTVVSKVDSGLGDVLPPYDGLRARVAVTDFEWNAGSSRVRVGLPGGGVSLSVRQQVAHSQALKDMLTTALVQSKRYRVLERSKIGSVKSEMELLGKRTGALLGAVGATKIKSSMALDIRIVDAKTTEVLAATSVQTEATDRSFGAALGALTGSKAMGGALGSYARTPMEKAIRSGIVEATKYIVENTPKQYMKH